MDREAYIQQIEEYILGALNAQERQDFELFLQKNPEVALEVEEYKLLLDSLALHQVKKLKADLEDVFEKQSRSKSNVLQLTHRLWKNYAPAMTAVAAVILTMIINSIFTLDNVRSLEEKQTSQITFLRKEIFNVKKEQIEMAKKQKEKNTEKKPVRQYGATAFVISSNGYLITNYHVIKNADSIYIEIKKDSVMRLKVKEVFSDPQNDLAILQVDDSSFIGFAPLPYAMRMDEAYLGESVYTLAYPRQDMVYGEGSISATSGWDDDTTKYQVSVPVNPGNSGGPLLDEKGSLIGVVSGKHSTLDGATFAVKARYLKSLVDSLNIQNNEEPITLPFHNQMLMLKRPEQIKRLRDFVYVVRVYDSKE
jgi:serine protease Do